MIKPSDLNNMAVQPGELTDREESGDIEIEALEHGEHKRPRSPADGAFDIDDERDVANDDEEEAT